MQHITIATIRMFILLGAISGSLVKSAAESSAAVAVDANQVAILTDQEKEELGRQLISAIKANDEEKVKELLAQGAPVNTRTQYIGETALMVAASYSYPNLFQLLLEADADVNVISEWGHAPLQDVIILDVNMGHVHY